MDRGNLLGVRVFAPIDRESLIDFSCKTRMSLIAINPEKVLAAEANPSLKRFINANIGYPDGMGTAVALRAHGLKSAHKIPGCELWLDIIRRHETDKSFFFVGATEEVMTLMISKLQSEFPRLHIKGFRNGFINSKTELEGLRRKLELARPDFVFVAMGSPRQELFIEELQDVTDSVFMGLGGSFDIYAGVTYRAPAYLIRYKMEWLYRLVVNPMRLGRNIKTLKFFPRIMWHLIFR